jgi:adsorption protein B
MLGYLVVLGILACWLRVDLSPEAYRYPTLVEQDTWLWYLILADTFFMGVRLYYRFLCVFHFFGWGQALLSIPRFFWANVINFCASSRAIYLFARYLATGKIIAWDKTAHIYPSEEELKSYRRKLGDLLLERRFITIRQLEEALSLQKKVQKPLGAILLDMGLIKENDLIQVLSQQLCLSSRAIDPAQISLDVLRLLPKKLAVRYSVVPLEIQKSGHLLLATTNLLTREQVQELEQALDRPVTLCLTYRRDLALAISRGYERLEGAPSADSSPFGLVEALLERVLTIVEQLQEVLKAQRRFYVHLGDTLIQEGIITPARLREALYQFTSNSNGRLGDFLVRHEYITFEQLQHALKLQKARMRPQEEVVADQNQVDKEVQETIPPKQTQ